MERCVCGNPLRVTTVSITRSPCRCPAPGPGRSQLPSHDLPGWLRKSQYEERKRLGLPVIADAER